MVSAMGYLVLFWICREKIPGKVRSTTVQDKKKGTCLSQTGPFVSICS